MWVSDEPNLGKTMLAVFISEYLEDVVTSDDSHWVLYCFCDGGRPNRKTAAGILTSLIFQLCKKKLELATTLYNDWVNSQDAVLQEHNIEPLWRIFQSTVNQTGVRRISIIIDGIDQCFDGTNHVEHLLKKISGYFNRGHKRRDAKTIDKPGPQTSETNTPTPELRMMILSRQQPEFVAQQLKEYPRILLDATQSKHQKSDLELYTHDRATMVSASFSKTKEPTEEVTDLVTQAFSDGKQRDFLCVRLAAERMVTMTLKQVKEYLKNIPESVQDMHIRTLLDVPSSQRTHVAAILKWVSLAVRPLTLLELRKAVKYTITSKSFSKRALKKALSLCQGLVQRQDNQVMLANQAVRELLFAKPSPLRGKKELRDFVFEMSSAHSDLANACIDYLETSKTLDRSRKVRLKPGDEASVYVQKRPFLEYAVAYWTFHAKNGNFEQTNYGGPFFKKRSPRLRLWWESYWISLRQSFAWRWTAPGDFSLLHIAAFFDIVPLARFLERDDVLARLQEAEDHEGMKPINRAVERSNAAMVKFLLEHGDYDDDALRQAAQTGDVSIMEMLLENRRDRLRNAKARSPPLSPTDNNPFKQARMQTLKSISNWSKKIDSAVDGGASPISPGMRSFRKAKTETPLHIAAKCGHEEAVGLLLKYGEDPFKPTDIGWTALQYAAYFGRKRAAQRLIDAGADGRMGTGDQLTPLHCAVLNNKPDVVEYLLSMKVVDIEATDNLGYTSFQMACRYNNIPIMEILLDYGASINQASKHGLSPLHLAAMEGHLDVVRWLVSKGVEAKPFIVRASIETGRMIQLTALGLAKARGHEGIVRLLEKLGPAESSATTAEVKQTIAAMPGGTYSVPATAVPEISNPMNDGSGTPALDDDLDASDSDDASDDASDSELRITPTTTKTLQNNEDSRKPSEPALIGLGLGAAVLPREESSIEGPYETPGDMIPAGELVSATQTSGISDSSIAPLPHGQSKSENETSAIPPPFVTDGGTETTVPGRKEEVLRKPLPVANPIVIEAVPDTVASKVKHAEAASSSTPNEAVSTVDENDNRELSSQPSSPPVPETGKFSKFGDKFTSWRNDASEAGKLSLQKIQALRSPKLPQESGEQAVKTPPLTAGIRSNEEESDSLASPPAETASTPKSGRSFSSSMASWRKKSTGPKKEDSANTPRSPDPVKEESQHPTVG